MEYKYELHCHTGDVSRCAAIDAEKLVEMYKEKGYDGIVITDHYSPQTFLDKHLFCPQREVDFYLSGYKKALAAAGNDFTVLLGMELRFYGNGNDYLVYGMTENFIRENGNLMTYYPRRFHKLAQKNNMIFIQAHPFRPYIFRTNPKYLDGCEIYNAKDRDKGINQRSEAWAEKYNMKIRTGGADFHREAHEGNMSGIITEKRIENNNDLLEILRKNEFKILK
jgi:predicted metal-dependent phosphoesterase TrpH